MQDSRHIKQAFQRSRRIGLWLGAAAPGLLLFVAILTALSSLPWFVSFGLVVVAVACTLLGSRAYRCPNCGAYPEADVPLFNPEACCACDTPLR
jgi:hypothetical protein